MASRRPSGHVISCSHTDNGGSHPLPRPFGTTYVRGAAGGRVWTPYTALDNDHAFPRRLAVQRLPGDQLGPSRHSHTRTPVALSHSADHPQLPPCSRPRQKGVGQVTEPSAVVAPLHRRKKRSHTPARIALLSLRCRPAPSCMLVHLHMLNVCARSHARYRSPSRTDWDAGTGWVSTNACYKT